MSSPLPPLRPHAAVAGGRDLDVPGHGVRLRATKWSGTGVPIVLLHGLASQRRFWNLVVSHLAGRPLVAIDQRGHGESDVPDSGYDTATVVDDVCTALDALGVSRAVVVGHSWGAVIALALAASRPERVLGVVALDGGLASPSGAWTREEARERLRPPDIAAPPEALAPLLAQGHLAPWWSADVEDAVLPIFGLDAEGMARSRLPVDCHLQVVDALYDWDPAATLPSVQVPAWVVGCQPFTVPDDEGGRAWLEEKQAGIGLAATALPQPRVLVWYGALHDVPLQWPALVAGTIAAAADEVGRSASAGTGIGSGEETPA